MYWNNSGEALFLKSVHINRMTILDHLLSSIYYISPNDIGQCKPRLIIHDKSGKWCTFFNTNVCLFADIQLPLLSRVIVINNIKVYEIRFR